MRVRPNKRFVFDVARFVKDVRHAAVELNTTPNKIRIECDIDPSTFTLLSGRQTSPLADTVLSLCSHVGLNPMDYLIDTDGVTKVPGDCGKCGRQFRLDGKCVECDFADGWRKCEFCCCNTNAKLRACCERGKAADIDGVDQPDGAKR